MIKAKKYKHQLPYRGWWTMPDRRVTVYGITNLGTVQTSDGPMCKVQLYLRTAEFANPDQDVAMLVGLCPLHLPNGAPDTGAPELFWWNDKYWVKATDGMGSEWCKQKCFLLYEVPVDLPEGYLEWLAEDREKYQVVNP